MKYKDPMPFDWQGERTALLREDDRWFLVRYFASLAVILCVVFVVIMTVSALGADHSTTQRGLASWYWQPQKLACGGRLTGRGDQRMYAASRRFTCGAQVRVTYGKKHVDVTIMDAGPFVRGRIIDLFPAPARALGMTGRGVVPVTVQVAR